MSTTDPYELDAEAAPPTDHAPTIEERLDKLEAAMAAFLEGDVEGMERVVRR